MDTLALAVVGIVGWFVGFACGGFAVTRAYITVMEMGSEDE